MIILFFVSDSERRANVEVYDVIGNVHLSFFVLVAIGSTVCGNQCRRALPTTDVFLHHWEGKKSVKLYCLFVETAPVCGKYGQSGLSLGKTGLEAASYPILVCRPAVMHLCSLAPPYRPSYLLQPLVSAFIFVICNLMQWGGIVPLGFKQRAFGSECHSFITLR